MTCTANRTTLRFSIHDVLRLKKPTELDVMKETGGAAITRRRMSCGSRASVRRDLSTVSGGLEEGPAREGRPISQVADIFGRMFRDTHAPLPNATGISGICVKVVTPRSRPMTAAIPRAKAPDDSRGSEQSPAAS